MMPAGSLIIGVLVISGCLCDITPSVFTPLGKIVGHYLISNKGLRYEAYEGIPYALSPVGDLRFQPPVPIKPWSEELTADKLKPSCWQHERTLFPSGSFVKGDEDCLYLNIYVPRRDNNATLPVILWIHGGAFQYGASEDREAHYLIDHSIIFVSLQYRLGALGFLSTEDEIVPGNMGLKDQSMALGWVKNNIKYFGGDDKRVTLTGLSAGGASVHYHYLSPMSAGLFHSGISFSGTAFDCWTQTENSREKVIQLGKFLGCKNDDISEVVKCLKKKPARDLTEVQAKFMPWKLNPFTPFGPVVEKSSEKPFIDKFPIEIIRRGEAYDVPWITGIVSEEGLYPVAEFASEAALKEVDENWETIAPFLLDYYYTIPKESHGIVARQIRKHYFGDKPINKENLLILTNLVGDRIFDVDAEKAAREQARANYSPVWFYYYSYRATDSSSNKPSNSTENFGVCHGDDVYLVLRNADIIPNKTSSDMAMHNDLVELWTSVAYNGVPKLRSKWTSVDPNKDDLEYLQISGPGIAMMESDDNLSQKLFWNSIDFDENRID